MQEDLLFAVTERVFTKLERQRAERLRVAALAESISTSVATVREANKIAINESLLEFFIVSYSSSPGG